MDKARRHRHFLLWAYVIMPEHVHVRLRPKDKIVGCVKGTRANAPFPGSCERMGFNLCCEQVGKVRRREYA